MMLGGCRGGLVWCGITVVGCCSGTPGPVRTCAAVAAGYIGAVLLRHAVDMYYMYGAPSGRE